jgi:hypothetical protein
MANHTDFDEPHKTLISKSMTYNNWVHIGQVISIAKYNSNLFYVESFTQKHRQVAPWRSATTTPQLIKMLETMPSIPV